MIYPYFRKPPYDYMGFKYMIILPWWFHILDADISGLYGYWSKDLVPGWSPKLAGIYGC